MPKCKIDLDASPTFKKLVRDHQRRFPKLLKDLEGAFSAIERDYMHAAQAAAIPGFNGTIWKYRSKCSDLQRGASGGIRIIAYYHAETGILYPLTFYFKKDKEDISRREIEKVINDLKEALEPKLNLE